MSRRKTVKKQPDSPLPQIVHQDLRSWSTSTWVRALVVVQLLFFTGQFTPRLCDNGDNARYLILGQALAEGRGYRNIQTPGEPLEAQYPILFPALLGIAQALSENLVFPKIMVAVLGALVTLLCYYLFRRQLGDLLMPFLVLVAVSGVLAQYSIILMSEVPYLFASLIALILLNKSLKNPDNKVLFWTTIVVSVLPLNCRSAGVAFSTAWIIGNVWNKQYRYAITHGFLVIATTVVFRSFVPSSPYLVQLFQRNSYEPEAGFMTAAEMLQRIISNLGKYGSLLVRSSLAPFAYKFPPFLGRILSTLIIIPMVIGWARTFFVGRRLIGLYLLFYFGILLMWQPQWSSERFLIAVVPFLYLFFLLGIHALVVFFDPYGGTDPFFFFRKLCSIRDIEGLSRRAKRGLWVLVGVLVFFNLHYQVAQAGPQKNGTPDWDNFYSCADWARIHTAPDAVIVSRKPELFYMRSKRKGVLYPFTHDVEKVIAFMEQQGVRYVVHDNFAWTRTTAKYLHPAIMSHPDRFKIVYALKNPDTFVLEFLKK